jgi:hypothetical protein
MDDSESSLWLPTPGVAGGGKKIPEDAVWSGKAAYKQDGTKVQVHLDRIETLLKTPTAQLAVNGGSQHPDQRKAGGHGPTLADEIEHLLPTPAVNDMGDGKTVEWWEEWTAKSKATHGNGNGRSLAIEALQLLPTPCASETGGERDLNHRMASGSQMELSDVVRLLPTPKATNNENRQSLDRYGMNLGMALDELFGEPTSPPSDAGND